MPKKILVVEQSATIQKLFSQILPAEDYSLCFVKSTFDAFERIVDEKPDAIFANVELPEIDGAEFVRILKKIGCEIPTAIYSTNKIPFGKFFANRANTPVYVQLNSLDADSVKNCVDKVLTGDFGNLLTGKNDKKSEKSAEISIKSEIPAKPKNLENEIDPKNLLISATEIWKTDSYTTAVLTRLFSLVSKRDSVDDVASGFLSLIAELCTSPLVSLYIVEVDGPHAYYISADGLDSQELSDFFNVCAAEFEEARPEINASRIERSCIKAECDLEGFFEAEVSLTSYENRHIKFSDGKICATLNLAKAGNFTTVQKQMLDFCAENIGVVLENALFLKSKAFYEERIRKAFSRFVPAEIIDDLAKKDVQKDVAVGETRQIAILFSDIRSFTNISEKNRPEVLVAFLNRYFTVMVDIIKKYGGTIDKFIGDAIMAEFGTPISYEDNTRRAAMAAYEMRQALPDVPLGDLVMPDGMTFNIGIGIHYGDAIVGSIGSKDKTDYSVIGDSVNLASRLEGLTKTYGVQLIVSESMKEDIVQKGNPDGFVFRHLDDVRVKGKKNAVPIYAIDRNIDEFPNEYRDAYTKGMDLYKQGVFRLAKNYFEKSLESVSDDKAAKLMLSRCEDFIENPPESWDGAISFTTK